MVIVSINNVERLKKNLTLSGPLSDYHAVIKLAGIAFITAIFAISINSPVNRYVSE